MVSSCEICGANAYSDRCFRHKERKPMKRSYINKVGPRTKRRQKAVRAFRDTLDDYEQCHYCKKILDRMEVVPEHKIGAGRRPDLVDDLDNIVPSCSECNMDKGSRSHDEYIELKFPSHKC